MSVQIITSRHTVNRLSDFQVDMVLEKDGVLYMPASFVMAFYVGEWSCEDAYVASRLDGQTTNCEISGSVISVYFNSPGFPLGQLKCRVFDSVDNAAFTDGTLDTCTPLTLPIEIVATAGDSEVISLYTDGYQPPATGIPKGDLEQSVQDTLDSVANKVDKESGKGLSTEDFTAALKAKLEALDPYTKAQVDAAIQEAVEGLGGGSVESVTINGVNHTPNNGIVDLGTVVGQQGPQGNVAITDAEQIVTIIENNLDSSDGNAILSARQGKILKQNIEVLWAKVNSLINDLAAMAFIGTKTSPLGAIDWTGGTFYATINKTLSGCTATDNTTNGQIAEGSTLTMTLTADSGFTLTGAIISVTNSRGQNVSYTLANNVLTIANVVGTINISVTAIGVFSVTNSDTHVDLTSQNMSPTTGSSWSGTVAIKSGVSGYGLAATPNVMMGGSSVDFSATGNSWNQTTGVMTIGSVMGDIVIVSASSEVVTHAVNQHLLNMISSNNAAQVIDGQSFSTTITPDTGCTDNDMLRVFMDGVRLTAGTDYTYNSSTGALSIPSVTGVIDIAASAAQGTVTIKANESGAAFVLTKADNSTATITCDTADGDLFVGSASGITSFKSIKASGASNLWNNGKIVEIDLGGAKFTGSAKFMFYQCQKLVKIENLVIKGTTTFEGAFQMNKITTIDLWHVESVGITSFLSMFQGCSVLETINGMCGLVTSSATSVASMFYTCSKLTSIDIRGWNLSSVTNFGLFASEALLLGDLDISISSTGLMTKVSSAFYKANALHTLTIGDFKVAENATVTNFGLVSGPYNGIKTIICKATTPPVMGTDWLATITNLNSIIVPSGSKAAYDAAQGWSTYANIITEES